MRALVAYGSKYGSTKEIAERIAKNLREGGMTVDLKNVTEEKVTAGGYDLAVVGSGIYAGKWMKPVLKFLQDGSPELSKGKVALFACCMDAADPKANKDAVKRYIADVQAGMPGLKVASSATFAGVVDFNKYGFVVKKIMKSIYVKRNEEAGSPEKADEIDWTKTRDYRDWNAIDAWSKDLLAK
ncbi:MAG: protoporphyrinogen oxidase [Methanomassiliicoccales archaeon PtaU1.Bin124]|nr:MAG: protoporphyrinogen oxidase [Methanomassiliicoccales archaeon PtaU1.Bin124]